MKSKETAEEKEREEKRERRGARPGPETSNKNSFSSSSVCVKPTRIKHFNDLTHS